MSQYKSQYKDLYNKVVQDAVFRRQLLEDPSAALTSIGIEPTHDLLHAIDELKGDVEKIHLELGGDDDDLKICVS
jgi:hypothetical protein